MNEHAQLRGQRPAQLVQLAAFLGQSAKSGALRLRLSTARIFGLVETDKGQVSLTELGRAIVDPARQQRAQADAFLAVPLYREVYEKYKSHLLPPPAALEREMAGLGVAKKQTAKARQAFERSADQSGFFAHGKDRLTPPVIRAGEVEPPAPSPRPTERYYGGGGGSFHPFIQGLLDSLPEPGSSWPSEARVKWLQTAANIFSLMYEGDERSSEIGIGMQRD